MWSIKKKEQNKRAFPRADFFQPSYFMIEGDASQEAMECWCNNISAGGIAFESTRGDLNNATVKILYKIGMHTLKDRLRVKHANKLMTRYRYGGQFEALDNKRTEIIQRYVEAKGSR